MPEFDDNADEIAKAAAQLFKDSYGKIINEIAQADVKFVHQEMERTIALKGIEAFLSKGFIPYAAASVILAFTGREVNKKNVKKLVKSLGIPPSNELLKDFDSLNYKNHLPYLNCVYLLLSVGAEPTEDKVLRAVAAMDIPAEPELAKFVMDMYRNDPTFKDWK